MNPTPTVTATVIATAILTSTPTPTLTTISIPTSAVISTPIPTETGTANLTPTPTATGTANLTTTPISLLAGLKRSYRFGPRGSRLGLDRGVVSGGVVFGGVGNLVIGKVIPLG